MPKSTLKFIAIVSMLFGIFVYHDAKYEKKNIERAARQLLVQEFESVSILASSEDGRRLITEYRFAKSNPSYKNIEVLFNDVMAVSSGDNLGIIIKNSHDLGKAKVTIMSPELKYVERPTLSGLVIFLICFLLLSLITIVVRRAWMAVKNSWSHAHRA